MLFAERDIEPGEEICIGYTSLKSVSRDVPYEECRAQLKNVHGIVCPEDCLCHKPEIHRLQVRGRELELSIVEQAKAGNHEGVVECCTLLLKNREEIRGGWLEKARTLNRAFKIGILDMMTHQKGKECGRKWYEIVKCILQPGDQDIRDYLLFVEDPSTLPPYVNNDPGLRLCHAFLRGKVVSL